MQERGVTEAKWGRGGVLLRHFDGTKGTTGQKGALAHLDGVHDAHRQLLGGHQFLIRKEGRLGQFHIYFTPDLVAISS